MANMIPLTAQPRDNSLKASALRRTGQVPCVIYGRDFAPTSVQVEYLLAVRTAQQAGTSQLIALTIEGDPDPHMVLIRDVQRDPVTDRMMHVDLYRVVAGTTIRNMVPLVTIGVAPVVESMGATISQVLNNVEVECLPVDMPARIDVDVSGLTELHHSVTVADLVIPENVTLLTELEADVIQVSAQRAEEVEEVVEVLGEAADEVEGEEEATDAEAEEAPEA